MVSAAFLIGVLVGALLRPFLDAYLRSATAHSYEFHPLADDARDGSLRRDTRERPRGRPRA
jgi:hypothetical protein